MADPFERTGDPELDDALALMERAHSCMESAAATCEENGRPEAVKRLELALDLLRNAGRRTQ